MEILVIFLLIAGLLVGWFFLMRLEIMSFLQRMIESASGKSQLPAHKQTTVRIVSVRHVAAHPAGSPEENFRMDRKAAGSDGGIPKWSIGE